MAAATNTTAGTIVLAGDLYGTDANLPTLVSSGVTPGAYGPVARLYVDSKGRTVAVGSVTSEELVTYVGTASYVARGITSPGQNINIASTVLSVNTASSSVKGIFTVQSPLISTAGVVTVDYTALPVASTSVKGIMQVGSGLAVSAGVLSRPTPDATTSSKGLVQVGTGFAVSSGVLSTSYGDATTSAKGFVQIGDYLQVSGGVISIPLADNSTYGIVQIGSGFSITGGVVSNTYGLATTSVLGMFSFTSDFEDSTGYISLPSASTTRTGLMTVSFGDPYLSISSGTLSYAVPDATTSSKGIVQIGSGLSVSSGVVSLTLPDATTSTKGVVQVGTNLAISAGVLSTNFPDATTSVKGVVQVGAGLAVSAGVLSADLPDATTSSKGIVQIDNSGYLSISGGVLTATVPDATTSSKGIVQIATNGGLSISGGVLTSQLATTSLKGIVTAGTGLTVSSGSLSFTVGDATTGAKGIVQPSSTYFSVTSGTMALLPASGSSTYGVVQPANVNNLTLAAGGGALDVGTNVSKLDTANTYVKAQVSALHTDTYSATYTPDFSQSNTYEMVLTGNVSLADPTNAVAGGVYNVILTQDGTGSRTLTLSGSGYKTNQTVTLSTTAGKRDILTLFYKSATEVFVQFAAGY